MEWIIGFLILIIIVLVIVNLKFKRELNLIDSILDGSILQEEFDEKMVSKLITKLKKKVQALNLREREAMSQKSNTQSLISDISHQTKTPLSNISMYIDLMERGKTLEYLPILKSQTDKLIFLNEQLIKGSRLEQGMIALHREHVLVTDLINIASASENIKVNLKDSDLIVFVDEKWTLEAISNVFNNAKKYGSKELNINIKRGSVYCYISIEDENKLIPESEYSKIFQRFYRGSDIENQEGYGLGLYISREILLSEGGGIKIQRGNSGNIFLITLPLYLD